MARKNYTEGFKESVVKSYKEGTKLKEIQRTYGVTYPTIYAWLSKKKMCYKTDPRRLELIADRISNSIELATAKHETEYPSLKLGRRAPDHYKAAVDAAKNKKAEGNGNNKSGV